MPQQKTGYHIYMTWDWLFSVHKSHFHVKKMVLAKKNYNNNLPVWSRGIINLWTEYWSSTVNKITCNTKKKWPLWQFVQN